MSRKRAREIRIHTLWCKACGICVAFCQPRVLEADTRGVPRVRDPGACTLCMLCELRCPDFAVIVIEDKEESRVDAAAAAHAG